MKSLSIFRTSLIYNFQYLFLRVLTSRTFLGLCWLGVFWPFEMGSHCMEQDGLLLGIICLPVLRLQAYLLGARTFFFSLFSLFLFFETESYYIALSSLELTDSHVSATLSLKACSTMLSSVLEFSGMCYYVPFFLLGFI